MILERIHLAIVQAVEQHGSLTAAAERLCVTQSALSHSVRKLEERLGTALWLRQGRSLRLTPAGQQVLILAQRVLPQLEQMEAKLAQIAQGQRGSLRIGMECHPCYQWLLKVVAPYLAAWPDVEVDVKQKFQFGGLTALLDYEIDLLVTPDPVYQPGLVFTPVFDYEQVHADGARVGRVANHGQQLAHARRLGLCCKFAQQLAPQAQAPGVVGDVDRVFGRKPVGRARLEPVGIGKAQHPAVLLGHQPGQPARQHVSAAACHVGLGRGIDLERARAVEHMVLVNGGNGGDIAVGAGADGGHSNK